MIRPAFALALALLALSSAPAWAQAGIERSQLAVEHAGAAAAPEPAESREWPAAAWIAAAGAVALVGAAVWAVRRRR